MLEHGLSVRNTSRLGPLALSLVWFVAFIELILPISFGRLGSALPIIWLGGGAAMMALFRYPRCHASTVTVSGNLIGLVVPF